jgi:hypothetical protein
MLAALEFLLESDAVGESGGGKEAPCSTPSIHCARYHLCTRVGAVGPTWGGVASINKAPR